MENEDYRRCMRLARSHSVSGFIWAAFSAAHMVIVALTTKWEMWVPTILELLTATGCAYMANRWWEVADAYRLAAEAYRDQGHS